MFSKPIDHPAQIKLLIQIQQLNDQLYKIEEQRGDLPRVIAQFELQIAELKEKLAAQKERIEAYERAIEKQQSSERETKDTITTCEKQQKEAKNDQEYDMITRALELAKLQITLLEKKKKRSM